jgi:hypothetical protein
MVLWSDCVELYVSGGNLYRDTGPRSTSLYNSLVDLWTAKRTEFENSEDAISCCGRLSRSDK